jgi:hypothetical protein
VCVEVGSFHSQVVIVWQLRGTAPWNLVDMLARILFLAPTADALDPTKDDV